MTHFQHTTVMRTEVIQALAPRDGAIYVDCTVGAGGHAEGLLEAASGATVLGIDRDPSALAASAERLARFGDRVQLVRGNFADVGKVLESRGIRRVDGLVADLGVSSPQVDDAARGMSFRHAGPLDMRMDPDAPLTALDLVAQCTDDELAEIIYRFGDERRSRRIARSVRRAYSEGNLLTTMDLRRAIVRAVGPARVGGVDPATRTFQALRVAVNGELDALEGLLGTLSSILNPGAMVAMLSFHSLEDRPIKHTFAIRDVWEPLWKKPKMASDEESFDNPRARSAKLRVARWLGELGERD